MRAKSFREFNSCLASNTYKCDLDNCLLVSYTETIWDESKRDEHFQRETLHSSIMPKSSSRFSFILKNGTDELDETISLLFSNIAQSQYKGDLAKLIRDNITYLVHIDDYNY